MLVIFGHLEISVISIIASQSPELSKMAKLSATGVFVLGYRIPSKPEFCAQSATNREKTYSGLFHPIPAGGALTSEDATNAGRISASISVSFRLRILSGFRNFTSAPQGPSGLPISRTQHSLVEPKYRTGSPLWLYRP